MRQDDHAALIRRLFHAFASGDTGTIAELAHEDIVWHTQGTSLLAGERHGRSAVLEQLTAGHRLSGGTYAIELIDVYGGATGAVARYVGRGVRHGATFALEHLVVYAIADGRVTAVNALAVDQQAFDAVWSGGHQKIGVAP